VENDVSEADKKLAFDMAVKIAEAQLAADSTTMIMLEKQAKPEYWFSLYSLCLSQVKSPMKVSAELLAKI
jgi:hypothetical protein